MFTTLSQVPFHHHLFPLYPLLLPPNHAFFPLVITIPLFLSFLVFLERGERREKGRERNMDWLPLTRPQLGTGPATQAYALTGNRTVNLLVCRLALNPLSHTSQGCEVFSLNPFTFFTQHPQSPSL